MSVVRCPKKRCREVMVERPGPFGQLDFVCVPCEVNAAGHCRRCPNPLVPKNPTKKGFLKYCPPCGVAVAREQEQLRTARRGPESADYQRRRREDPVIYAGILAANRARPKPKTKRDDLDRRIHNEYKKRRLRGAPRVTVDRRKKVAA